MKSRFLRAAATAALLVTAVAGVSPVDVRAQDVARYEIATTALYRVDPEGGTISVSIDVTFTNETPDPADGYTVFPEALLAVHQGAADVAAHDGEGELEVATEPEGDANVATVTLRDPIRFEETATFTLEYALADQAAEGIRVRPSATVFPAWGFGTQSTVTVELPAGYGVSVRGDALEEDEGADGTTLTSGPIDEPAQWVAIVTADRETEFVTVQRAVTLDSGSADLRVEAWSDDEAWGARTLELLSEALPILEREIGLPYEHPGPLVVTESVSRSQTGFDGQDASGILLGFDQPPFTALHEAAHIWIGPNVFASRWIYEGFASHYAQRTGAQLEVAPPYDAAEATEQHADIAFPLEEWLPDEDASADGDTYGYPASWLVASEIAARAGDEPMREVFRRINEGRGAYGVAGAPSVEGAVVERIVDSRALLDHLEQTVGIGFEDLFVARVFTPETQELLPARTEARAAFAELVTAAGEWGAPEPVAEAMSAWEFDTAMERIEEANAWLTERDALVSELEDAGLEAPDSLRASYQASAGLPDGQAELIDGREFLTQYLNARTASERRLSGIERVGLFGGRDAGRQLDEAAARFNAGDVDEARQAVSDVTERLDGASSAGMLRVASVIIFFFGLIVIAVARLIGRRRRPAD